ncbi:MAG: AGE family epimerase/isomerase [Dysgonamonadaceae bacterium]|nr:AGE family epimerase/isomerase [Dysgonamonadaceae bacterium]
MNLKNETKLELTTNILPYWINNMQDNENGGFYGRIDGNNIVHKNANKGGILNARILWTFSSAYRLLGNPEYLFMAERAFQYLTTFFIDKKNGGIFWELDYKGKPVNTKKQTYLQGFALYGFSEFYRATGNPEALELSKKLFQLIEKHCYDPVHGGYFEAFTSDWQPIEDMRLSKKDANEKKTMNTHLHILEPYTNLIRIWEDDELKSAQRNLIGIFANQILDKQTYHLNLFFDEKWNCKSTDISYGHDIEASWLLFEAAEVLGDEILIDKIKCLSIKVADAALEGLQPDGSLIYETHEGHLVTDRHWWVQAETVVGLVYAWQNSGNEQYLEKAEKCWRYIQQHIIDKNNGEWFWSIDSNGKPNHEDDKAGFWKCPYHNGRMCFELFCNKFLTR